METDKQTIKLIVPILLFHSYLNASSLFDLFSNGKIKSDVSVSLEQRGTQKNIPEYESGTSYAVSTFALKQEDFEITPEFNAYTKLYENHESENIKGEKVTKSNRYYTVNTKNKNGKEEEILLSYLNYMSTTDSEIRDFNTIYSGKLAYEANHFGIQSRYFMTNEQTHDYEDSNHTQLKTYAKISDFTFTLGHLSTNEDASFKYSGRNIPNDLEEGDHIYKRDAQTTYLSVNKKFDDFEATTTYGKTNYEEEYNMSEFNLLISRAVNKKVKFNIGYVKTSEDLSDEDTEDSQKINATIIYRF